MTEPQIMPSLGSRPMPKILATEPKVTGFGSLALKKSDQMKNEPAQAIINSAVQQQLSLKKESEAKQEEDKKMDLK